MIYKSVDNPKKTTQNKWKYVKFLHYPSDKKEIFSITWLLIDWVAVWHKLKELKEAKDCPYKLKQMKGK